MNWEVPSTWVHSNPSLEAYFLVDLGPVIAQFLASLSSPPHSELDGTHFAQD